MNRVDKILTLVLLAGFLGFNAHLSAASFGVNLYGFSHHLNNHELLKRKRLPDWKINESNPGLGLRFDFSGDSSRVVIFLEGGFFEDSFEETARYFSVGTQYRIWKQLRIGINSSFYATRSTNDGAPFLAPVPLISYKYRIVTANFVYLPEYKEINPFQTLGGYLTLNFRRE